MGGGEGPYPRPYSACPLGRQLCDNQSQRTWEERGRGPHFPGPAVMDRFQGPSQAGPHASADDSGRPPWRAWPLLPPQTQAAGSQPHGGLSTPCSGWQTLHKSPRATVTNPHKPCGRCSHSSGVRSPTWVSQANSRRAGLAQGIKGLCPRRSGTGVSGDPDVPGLAPESC